MGPSAIRYAGLEQQLGEKVGVRVSDAGNVISPVAETAVMGDENSRYLDQILDLCDRLARMVADAAGRGAMPLVLGRDHSCALRCLVRIAHARGGGFLHVALDMDAVDPEYAPGVGTPVRGGLSYREAHLAMETVAESGLLDSMDVVEVNPILDRENATGQLAVELVASALGARIL